MLALQFAFVFLMQGAGWGQGFITPVPYNFLDNPSKISQRDNTTGILDFYELETIDANGYGQWAANTSGRWFLIGDTLIDPSTNPAPINVAAFDTIDHNNTSQSSTSGQIVLVTTSSVKDKGDDKIQSLVQDTSDIYCFNLTEIAHKYWEDGIPSSYKKSNDTFHLFVEQCGFKHFIANYGSPGWAFDELATDVDGMDISNSRWLEFRQWLFKVLYYNSDTIYYCRDVNAMFSTFQYLTPGRGKDYNGLIAIFDYLVKNNRCPDKIKYLVQQRKFIRDQKVNIWRDSVGSDSVKRPIDTSVVTIDQIGFSILRGQNGVVATMSNIHGLGNLNATKNPFSDQTTIGTSIADAMMVKLEIFDVLGKQLYTENRFFSAGDVRWTLDGKGLPGGSLYVRLSTIGGKVKTVKLVHDK